MVDSIVRMVVTSIQSNKLILSSGNPTPGNWQSFSDPQLNDSCWAREIASKDLRAIVGALKYSPRVVAANI